MRAALEENRGSSRRPCSTTWIAIVAPPRRGPAHIQSAPPRSEAPRAGPASPAARPGLHTTRLRGSGRHQAGRGASRPSTTGSPCAPSCGPAMSSATTDRVSPPCCPACPPRAPNPPRRARPRAGRRRQGPRAKQSMTIPERVRPLPRPAAHAPQKADRPWEMSPGPQGAIFRCSPVVPPGTALRCPLAPREQNLSSRGPQWDDTGGDVQPSKAGPPPRRVRSPGAGRNEAEVAWRPSGHALPPAHPPRRRPLPCSRWFPKEPGAGRLGARAPLSAAFGMARGRPPARPGGQRPPGPWLGVARPA